jgi:hypothetical protein
MLTVDGRNISTTFDAVHAVLPHHHIYGLTRTVCWYLQPCLEMYRLFEVSSSMESVFSGILANLGPLILRRIWRITLIRL